MKATNSLTYLLGLPAALARYSLTGKLTSFENIPMDQDSSLIKSILHGKILTKGGNPKVQFKNSHEMLEENLENPCYIYFSEDSEVDVKFAYFNNGFPLQVAPQHIFFWPGQNRSNFTVQLDSNRELSDSNTAIYCGDLGDILGEHTIEGQRAESVRLGSFPSSPFELKHEGYFRLTSAVQKGCHVELHFPIGHAPSSFKFKSEELNKVIHIERQHSDRSLIMTGFDEISRFEKENDLKVVMDSNIYFDVEYSSFDHIAYSYNIVSQVMCPHGEHDIDQFELVEEEVRQERLDKVKAEDLKKEKQD